MAIMTFVQVEALHLRACTVASRVISKIESLGLSVATEKTEATLFYGKRAGNLLDYITINQVCIDLAPSIKYLGVYIDNGWTFTDHFRYIEEKAGRVIKALNRLMPNLRGPDENRRRLFAHVVLSVILYGAPVWGDDLARNRLERALNRLEHSVAQRVISAYRKKIFEGTKRLRQEGEYTREKVEEIKNNEYTDMCERWRRYLERPNTPGEYTKLAIVPNLEVWWPVNTEA
ncbi:reverse transcriptase [Lasius niger]|uniref:Reverse transcriptase n=1 Tax=Lasius niger TaxID=67767 RepID=A0A0J7K214_LASNI|nr:reverse transcriptase [Lasius niger]